MFDYHNYLALIAAICAAAKDGDADAAEDLGFLRDAVKNFVEYVAAVDLSEVGIDTAPGLLEGEALRTEVTALDRDRSTHHNAAIASAGAINRIAALYGVGKIYGGDPEKRREVAQFCLELTETLFRNRR